MARTDVRANGPIVFTTTAGAAARSCVSSDSNEPDTTPATPRPAAVRSASRPAITTRWPASRNRRAIPRPERPVAPSTQMAPPPVAVASVTRSPRLVETAGQSDDMPCHGRRP